MRRRFGALTFYSPEERAIADSSRAKNNVFALSEVISPEDTLQILFVAIRDQLLSFLFIAWLHFALHLATEAFDPRCRQHRFWRTADSHIKIDIAFG